MTEPREALAALRRFLVTHMQDTHHEDDDGCYDGAESALLALEARSEGPGLDALREAARGLLDDYDAGGEGYRLHLAALRAALASQENPEVSR